jgi:hypothetical protein
MIAMARLMLRPLVFLRAGDEWLSVCGRWRVSKSPPGCEWFEKALAFLGMPRGQWVVLHQASDGQWVPVSAQSLDRAALLAAGKAAERCMAGRCVLGDRCGQRAKTA